MNKLKEECELVQFKIISIIKKLKTKSNHNKRNVF